MPAIEPPVPAGRKHAPGLPRAQSLNRAAALVRAVGERPGATTAQLARACDLPVATAARLLATLSDEGFAERTVDGGGWTLGLPLVRLARAADPDRALLAAGRPVLEEVAALAGESAALAVPRPGPAMDVIAQADGPGLLGVSGPTGRLDARRRRALVRPLQAAADQLARAVAGGR